MRTEGLTGGAMEFFDVVTTQRAMRRLKAEMDPAGMLNPGRYVGGI